MAAVIVAEALLFGDKAASATWSVSTKTVARYRKRAEEDGVLSRRVLERKAQLLDEGIERDAMLLARQVTRRIGQILADAGVEHLDVLFNGLTKLADFNLERRAVDGELEAQRARRSHPEGVGGRPAAAGGPELH